MGLINKAQRFEVHHQVLVFILVFVGTIGAVRFLIALYNPNPVIFNLEIHHFDYGILILLFSSEILIFGSSKFKPLCLVLVAFASALIIDDYLFIRHYVTLDQDLSVYNQTFPFVLIAIGFAVLSVFAINSIRNKKIK